MKKTEHQGTDAFFFFSGFHTFIGAIGAIGAGAAPCQRRRSQSLQPLQARALGVLGVAGHVGHVPVVSEGHWVVVGCGLVDHERVLGVGAECGQDYSEAHNGEGYHEHRFFGPDILEEGCDSLSHLGLGGSG